MQKVLLINPPSYCDSASPTPNYLRSNRAFNYAPLGLLYLAANLDEKIECRVLDAIAKSMTIDETMEVVRDFQPDIIGITSTSDVLYSAKAVCDGVRQLLPKSKIVFGGPHATIFPAETIAFDSVSYVLTGYSENTFSQLVDLLTESSKPDNEILEKVPGLWWKHEGVVKKSPIDWDSTWDVKTVKHPDRTLIDWSDYFIVTENQVSMTLLSTRGCPFRCTFCDIPEKSFLIRDLDDLINEIKEIRNLGIKHVHFFDDVFNLKRNRVVEICNRMIEEKLDVTWSFRGRVKPCDNELAKLLSKAGCTRVQLGVESANQETIDKIKKQINLADVPEVLEFYRNNGIKTLGYFIIGFPHQTKMDVIEELEAIRKYKFDYVSLAVLLPYPNTAVYQDLLENGNLEKDYWLDHARNPDPNFTLPDWHPHLTSDELYAFQNKFNRKFYISPTFILSEIKRGFTFDRLFKQSKVALSMLISR